MINNIIVEIPTDKKFSQTIRKEMKKEFDSACKKWGLSLSNKDRDKIFYNTLLQLKAKIEVVSGFTWNSGDPLKFVIKNYPNGDKQIYDINSDEIQNSPFRVKRTSDKWRVCSTEEDSNLTPISSLDKIVKEEIIKWVRTGVYYGVASYK